MPNRRRFAGDRQRLLAGWFRCTGRLHFFLLFFKKKHLWHQGQPRVSPINPPLQVPFAVCSCLSPLRPSPVTSPTPPPLLMSRFCVQHTPRRCIRAGRTPPPQKKTKHMGGGGGVRGFATHSDASPCPPRFRGALRARTARLCAPRESWRTWRRSGPMGIWEATKGMTPRRTETGTARWQGLSPGRCRGLCGCPAPALRRRSAWLRRRAEGRAHAS